MRERNRLDAAITVIHEAETELADTIELVELAEMEGDDSIVEDAVAGLRALQDKMKRAELEALLSGEADGNEQD